MLLRSYRSWFVASLATLAVVLAAQAPARAQEAPAAPSAADSVALTPAPTPVPTSAIADSAKAPSAKAPKAKKVREPKVNKPKVKTPPPQGPWDKGATWLSVRAGYARAAYRSAGPGNAGFGFGVNRMLNPRWSFGGYAQYDVLGKFGHAVESEAPFTLELARHYRFGEAFRPYLGVGGGTYYHKNAGTGADLSDPRGGGYLLLGGNTPLDARQLLGIDIRMAVVKGEKDRINPVFGVEKGSTIHWSAKLNWSLTY
jgi:hypothetical protein